MISLLTRWLVLPGLAFSGLLHANDAHKPLPKYQFGVGPVVLVTPDYRGSKQTSALLLPFPLIIYRGERLVIDNGIDGILLETFDFKLSVSGSGSPPVSNDSPLRDGMRERPATVEIGPSMEWLLWFPPEKDRSLWFEWPIRSVHTLDGKTEHVGINSSPRLAWRKPPQHRDDWKRTLMAGPLFADSGYHDYFYSVAAPEVNAQRSRYNSPSGYSGFRMDYTFSRNIDRYWLGGFVRYDNVDGAVFADSPLVETAHGLSAGLTLAWIWKEG